MFPGGAWECRVATEVFRDWNASVDFAVFDLAQWLWCRCVIRQSWNLGKNQNRLCGVKIPDIF
jgi:hypothetical protein